MMMVETATKVAWSFIGTPYIWGGDDFSGFDCSGFVIEVLKSVGKLPREGDWSAATLQTMFQKVDIPHEGCLVFWKNAAGNVNHVEYCLDEKLSIGASGGDSDNTSVGQAIKENSYIKVRPFNSRKGIAGFVNPFL